MKLARLVAALWGLVIVTTLAIGAFGPASWRDAIANHGPACPFRMITGVACPCCGMTHATLALGHGELRASLAYHPLAPLVVLGMLAAMIAIVRGPSSTGRRSHGVLATIAVVWLVRLAA